MAIGVAVIEQIVVAAKARAAGFLTTAFKLLPYSREYQKNPGNIPWGYGFNVLEAEPGDNQVIGSYCLTLQLELVLIASIVKKNSEREIETAVYELHAWIDRAAKDFRLNKLGIPNVVVKVGDHKIDAPEYFSDSTQIALKAVFPVTFRQALN